MHKRRDKPEGALFHCPFLGLDDDPETALSFPSKWNSCHHCKPVVGINFDHQREYCLSKKFSACAAFLQPPDQSLPDEIYRKNPTTSGKRAKSLLVRLLAILAILIAFGGFFLLGTNSNLSSINNTIEELLNSTTLRSIQPSPSFTSSTVPKITTIQASGSPTLQPTSTTPPTADTANLDAPTFAVTRTPHQLESLIGHNFIFRIHRTKRAEDIHILAYDNYTTVPAILTVNYIITYPLEPHYYIVIPYNRSDVSDLPRFETYQVKEDTSVDHLAAQLGVDPYLIQFYNGLESFTQLYKGEWLIIPREKSGGE